MHDVALCHFNASSPFLIHSLSLSSPLSRSVRLSLKYTFECSFVFFRCLFVCSPTKGKHTHARTTALTHSKQFQCGRVPRKCFEYSSRVVQYTRNVSNFHMGIAIGNCTKFESKRRKWNKKMISICIDQLEIGNLWKSESIGKQIK